MVTVLIIFAYLGALPARLGYIDMTQPLDFMIASWNDLLNILRTLDYAQVLNLPTWRSVDLVPARSLMVI